MTPDSSMPSPALIMETLTAYQRTAALKAAIDLSLFTAIAEGNSTVPQLVRRCSASDRGLRILCDYLTILGFLTKDETGYALSPTAAVFLNQHSPVYLGGVSGFLLHPFVTGGYDDLAATVRRGHPPADHNSVGPENPIWVDFARCMAPMMRPVAMRMAAFLDLADRPARILDIAAGHGLFGIACAQQAPGAHITAVDWAPVLGVALENAQAASVVDRYQMRPGSAFDVDFGTGYDVVLLTNFLHHFDEATNITLLKKVRAALAPGGRVFTLEFVPNADRVSPPQAAAFSLQMLTSTQTGDAYTYAQLSAMCQAAGFARSELHDLSPLMNSLVISYT